MMKFVLFLITIVSLNLKQGDTFNCAPYHEKLLKYQLFCLGYDKTIRPVFNQTSKTYVGMHMVIRNYDIDENLHKMRINTWMRMSWKDEHLKWKPEDHDQILTVVEKSTEIWTPRISVLNTDISQTKEECNSVNCRIKFDGSVRCDLPCSYVVLCELDLTYWPFDRHNCSLNLGTMYDTVEKVNYNLEKSSVIHKYHIEHNQWKLLYTDVIYDDGVFNVTTLNETYEYPSLEFYFVIERHSSIVTALILSPVFILTVFNLIGLWLEPGSFIRLTLFILNLTLHILVQHLLIWCVPENGKDNTKIVIYFRDSILLTGILLLETVITRSIARFQKVPSIWLETGTHYISDSPVGRYFVCGNINEFTSTLDDSESLVEVNQHTTEENSTWKLFAKLIDRILFLIYVIVYVIMFFSLVPMNYEKLPTLETKVV